MVSLTDKKKDILLRYATAVSITVLVFLYVYGTGILDVTNIEWIRSSGGDIYQHYLGWLAFRNSPWSFPLGLGSGLNGSDSYSIVLTDSIPGFAFIFKLLRNLIPDSFQYFGIYGLMSYVLMAVFTTRICGRFKADWFSSLMITVIVCFNPIMIERMYDHTALASFWLLLWSLDIMLSYRDEEKQMGVDTLIQAALLGFLTVSVHIYYTMLCGIVMGILFIYGITIRKNRFYAILLPEIYCIAALGAMWLWGADHVGSTIKSNIEPYGFNLNSFFNPHGKGLFLPSFPVYSHVQNLESYQYLGAGVLSALLLLSVYLLVCIIRKIEITINKRMMISVAVVCVVAAFLSLSNQVTFNDIVLFSYSVPDSLYELWALFRTVSRLMWIAYYLLIIYALIGLRKILRGKMIYLVMPAVVLIQMIDLYPAISSIRNSFHEPVSSSAYFSEPVWDEVDKNTDIDEIVFMTVDTVNMDNNCLTVLPVTEFALEHGMTVNQFYFARFAYSEGKRDEAIELLRNQDGSNAYIFLSEDLTDPDIADAVEDSGISLYETSGFYVGLFD